MFIRVCQKKKISEFPSDQKDSHSFWGQYIGKKILKPSDIFLVNGIAMQKWHKTTKNAKNR